MNRVEHIQNLTDNGKTLEEARVIVNGYELNDRNEKAIKVLVDQGMTTAEARLVASKPKPKEVKVDYVNPSFATLASKRAFFIWALHIIGLISVNLGAHAYKKNSLVFDFNMTSSVAIIISLVFFTLLIDIVRGVNK